MNGPTKIRMGAQVARPRTPSPEIKLMELSNSSLFIKKIEYCMNAPTMRCKEKIDTMDRREYLDDILNCLQTKEKVDASINPNLERILKLIETNLFRPLPKLIIVKIEAENTMNTTHDQMIDPTWNLVKPVYDILIKILESEFTDHKIVKAWMNDGIIIQKLLDLFDSENVTERETLRMVLHLIYLKLMSVRKTVRKCYTDLFLRLIHEEYKFNGVSEILDIVASIISGFSIPIKDEHTQFFNTVIMPLHKVQTCQLYHAELSKCTLLFVQKKLELGVTVIEKLARYWPIANSTKQIKFLEEIIAVVMIVPEDLLQSQMKTIFYKLSQAVASPHFKVCDYGLSCFERPQIVALIKSHIDIVFPMIVPVLERESRHYWQPTLRASINGLKKMIMQVDPEKYDFYSQNDQSVPHPFLSDQHYTRWKKISLIASKGKPSSDLGPHNIPYKSEHIVGEHNGINNTNAITPEIL